MLYEGRAFQLDWQRFWGFRYPLGRTFWEYEAPDRVHLREGIFSAIHDQLDNSREEIRRLAQHLAATSQRLGNILSLQLLDQAIPLESLCAERILEYLHDDEFRYGLVHFACHCEQPQGFNATEAYLSFTAHGKQMEMSLEQLLTWQDQRFLNRPFVFLNACESAGTQRLLQTLSFPAGLLGFGAVGVIATACIIPDNFASAFADEFYRQLLNNPGAGRLSNIGEALLKTRLHFLREFNNPLGLAYGLYAVSDQKLRLLD
jgi:CHAT domain-containing protein